MNVTFHVLAGAGIAHVAAIQIQSSKARWFCRSDLTILGIAICRGGLSHGILDGLKHGYPIRPVSDVLCGSLLALCGFFVYCRYCVLVASVILASLAPDIVDLGPKMLWSAMADFGPLFLWHWPDGPVQVY